MKSTKLGSFLIALVVALVGYFILPFINIEFAPAAPLFAIGILLGAVIGILLSSDKSSASSDEDDSEERQTLYVGNLPYRANEAIVRELFEKYGNVYSVRLVKDKQTGRRRGFGFVTMDPNGAQTSMDDLNDKEFQERVLKVREAKEKTNTENTSQAEE
jgi:RNA recognition motif-containing protein